MSEAKDDGGPAFPTGYDGGMSLRDYFAGQALAGLMSNSHTAQQPGTLIVEMAYLQADAMLEARKK